MVRVQKLTFLPRDAMRYSAVIAVVQAPILNSKGNPFDWGAKYTG